MSLKKYLIFLFLLFFPLWAGGDDAVALSNGDISINTRLDWREGGFLLALESTLTGPLTLKTRFNSELKIEEDLSAIFLKSIESITLDSRHIISDIVDADGSVLERLEAVVKEGEKRVAYLSQDRKSVLVEYIFPLFGGNGLIAVFVTHERPRPIERSLGFVPAGNFTGIVIYAKGMYPLYGKDEEVELRPAFFPRIFDEEMDTVLEKEMCNPESLRRWGMAAYSESLDLRSYSGRIGPAPLHLVARGIFGVNNTDVIISEENARQLLATENNRELLTEGRILIILDYPS